MDVIILLGYIASVASVVTFIPQLLKVIRSKSTQDVSALMYILCIAKGVLWLVYAIYMEIWPVLIAETLMLLQTTSILCLVIYYRHTQPKKVPAGIIQSQNM